MGVPSCHTPSDALGSTVIGALTAPAVAALSVIVGGIPRVLLASDALPAWLRPFVWSDVLHLWERGLREDRLPYTGAFFEYPPLVGGLWALIQSFAGSAAGVVVVWLVVQAAAAALAAYVMTRSGDRRRAVIFWAATPQLVLHGSTNFDVLAVAALVIAVAEARRSRHLAGAVALAVGAMLKLFPAAALPIVLLDAPRAAAVRAGAVFAAICAAAFAATSLAPFPSTASLVRYSVGIDANPDSIWGLAAMVARGLGADAPGGWLVGITIAGTAATCAVVLLSAARRRGDPAAATGLLVVSILLWSRLYSPQYALWVLPFFALLPLPFRTFAAMTAADVAVHFSVYPLTLVAWPPQDPARMALLGVLAGAVVLRHIALIAVWRALWRQRAVPAPAATRATAAA